MPISSSDSTPSSNDKPQAHGKRAHPLMGIAIGIGALIIVLVFAAISGGLLFSLLLRAPQTTLAPPVTSQVEDIATQAPQAGLIPTTEATRSPEEVIAPEITATPPEEQSTIPLETLSVSYELIVNVKSLNVRTGPSTLYPVVITYPEGTRLIAIGRNSDASWFVIAISSTQTGWVSVPLVKYDFDRYVLPVIPAPPLEIKTPTPYGSAILVPPELIGSNPLAPILPAKRMISFIVASLLVSLLAYLEKNRLTNLAKKGLMQVPVLGANLFPFR